MMDEGLKTKRDILFEQTLSFKPKFDPPNEEPCLRDMVFNYYAEIFEEDKADRLTKAYIEQLYAKVIS